MAKAHVHTCVPGSGLWMVLGWGVLRREGHTPPFHLLWGLGGEDGTRPGMAVGESARMAPHVVQRRPRGVTAPRGVKPHPQRHTAGQKHRRAKAPGVLLVPPWHSPLSLGGPCRAAGSALSCPVSRAGPFSQPSMFSYLPSREILPRPMALSQEVPPVGGSAIPCVAWRHRCHLAPRLIVVL